MPQTDAGGRIGSGPFSLLRPRFRPDLGELDHRLGAAVHVELLQHGAFDKHLRQLRAALAARQQRALLAIEKHFPDGTRVTRPEGGYFLWVELPDAVDAMALQQAALARHISVAPGSLFSADKRFRHHLRLNVGHPRLEQLDAALKTLGRLVG